jgi:DNA-binding response OmpR family regulator/signal transduction histidine kinase
MASSSKKTLQILLIEDNDADAEMIRIYLNQLRQQNKVIKAESLSEGLRLLGETEESIDIVLLDLGLPDSIGFNTLRRYLDASTGVPVIVMTGLSDQRKGTESVRAGAQDYLVKGEFNAEQLMKSIRYSMERFRLQANAEKRANLYSDEKSRLKELQQMASIGDWEMDIVNNSMIWSEELFEIFQIKPHSFSPSLSDYLALVHRTDRDKVERFFAQAVKKEEHGPLEHRILIENRLIKNLSLRTRIKFDEKSNRILLLGSVQDITPQEEASGKDNKGAGKNSDSLVDNNAYTRELFNQISFNIRTPLSTAVHLFYLLEQTNLNTHQAKLVDDLKTTIDDLSFTLSNLVNLSILSNDNLLTTKDYFRPLDVLESIQRVMNFKAQQNNRELDIYIDPHLGISVQSDSNKLAQLFFSMMELAFLYSDDGTFIKLRCTREDGEDKNVLLAVQLEYSGRLPDWPEITRDASTEEVLSLLQPKLSTEGREKLLASVFQRLCRQLNVKQQSSKAKGGVFVDLVLPFKPGKVAESMVPKVPQKKLSILLVEDHPMHQIATKQVLTTWSSKVNVTVANNGQVALVKAQEEVFDIILMDLQMPVMDGMTATANLRAFSSVPIIALTASTSKQEEDRCYQIGMNDYLAKPFQPEDLYRRIMQLIYEEEK